MRQRTPDPVTEMLRAVPGLAHLPDRALATLVPLVDQAEIPAGGVLTREGDASRQAFIIVSGRGTVLIDGEPIATVGPGDFVGEMGMLQKQPRSATVRADVQMHVLVIGPAEFDEFLEHPRIGTAIAAQLAHRLRRVELSGV